MCAVERNRLAARTPRSAARRSQSWFASDLYRTHNGVFGQCESIASFSPVSGRSWRQPTIPSRCFHDQIGGRASPQWFNDPVLLVVAHLASFSRLRSSLMVIPRFFSIRSKWGPLTICSSSVKTCWSPVLRRVSRAATRVSSLMLSRITLRHI